MFEIEYEFREQDLIHFNERQLVRTEDVQNNMRKNRLIVPGIMMMIGAYYYFYYGSKASAAYIGVIAILWAMLSPRLMLLDLRRQILSNYTDKEKHSMFGIYRLSIDKDNLIQVSPSGKHKTPWSDVVRVEWVKDHVFIFLDLHSALVIPKDTIKSGNIEEFGAQAEKMIANAA